MTVFLTVLKIIGIVLLSILGFLLVLVLLLLFWPFFYSVEAAKTEEITAKAKVSWLLHIVVVEVIWQNSLNKRLKLFGIPVYDQKRKEAKAAAKAEKEKKKAEAAKAKEDKKKTDAPQERKEDLSADKEETQPADGHTDTEQPELPEAKENESEEAGSSPEEENATPGENDTPETIAEKDAAKGKKKKLKSFDGFLDWLEKKWDQFMDFLDRAPDKLADWLEYLPDKAEELIGTIEYYDRLLNSEGTEWVINYVKDHGGKLLLHVLPYRTDGTLDYCDDDPGNVARIYEYQALALPLIDKICGRRGQFDILALQDEKKVHLTVKTKGRLFLIYLAWHGGCLVLNKKVKAFLKRLKREEE